MWHNQEVMVGWKEVMTKEEFQEKQPKPLKEVKPSEVVVTYDGEPVVPFEGSLKFIDFVGENKVMTVVEETVTQAEPFMFSETATREKVIKFGNKVKAMGV